MTLPNPLSGVLQQISKKQSTAEWIAENSSLKQNPAIKFKELAESNDKMVLAYIWIATEMDYNIIVSSSNETAATSLIESITMFVPIFQKVIDIRYKGAVLDNKINFLNLVSKENYGKTKQLEFIRETMPDRIVVINPEKQMNKIFSLSLEGISFTASIKGDPTSMQLTKILASSPFKVNPQNLHMLDLSVILSSSNGASISSITEYRWLEKGEIIPKDDEMISKRYANIKIIENGLLNSDQILNSKLIREYSKENLITKTEALDEIKRRAEFLDELCKTDFNKTGQNPLEMYYEIK